MEASDFRQLADALNAAADAMEVEAEPAPAKRRRGKKAAEEEEPEAEEPAPKAKKGKAKKSKTLDEVKEKLVELSEAKDKQAVKDVLGQFEVTKLGDLAEESYNDCYDAAQAAIDEDDDAEPEEEDPFAE